jgi:hypothetical protein
MSNIHYHPAPRGLTNTFQNIMLRQWLTQCKKSKLSYDRRLIGQPLLVSGHYMGTVTNFSFTSMDAMLRQLGVCYYGVASLARGRVDAARPRQRSLSCVWVPRDSWPYFTASILRLSQLGGPGSCIYFTKEHVAQLNPRALGSLVYRLLRLAGLRWWYSNPPPHGVTWHSFAGSCVSNECCGSAQNIVLLTAAIITVSVTVQNSELPSEEFNEFGIYMSGNCAQP